MKLEGFGIENNIVALEDLDFVFKKRGFYRGENSDYERANFDRKFELNGETYYLRVQGFAVEGDVDKGNADVKLLTPILGKHYYPHGVEYGEDENFPSSLVNKAKEILKQAGEELKQFIKE